jgi:hypothetical protein
MSGNPGKGKEDREMKRKIFASIFSVAILLAGVIAFSHSRKLAGVPLRSGFIINYTFSEHGLITGVIKRQVKQNGEFLEDVTYTDGRHTTFAGTENGGAVVVDGANKKLNYVGGALIAQRMTMEQTRKSAGPYYVRDDVMLGYDVVVSERCTEDRSQCTTFWEAPELGNNLLRKEEASEGVVHIVREAVAVTLGEPSFTVPDYPVDKSRFEQRQKARAEPGK